MPRTYVTVLIATALLGCARNHNVVSTASMRLRVDSGMVRANGTDLYYEAAGSGPVVVLVHGGNMDRRMWDRQFDELARNFRVIRYDCRGYGRSARPDSAFRAEQDLKGLIDALHIERASIVGHSGGGRIAIDFALAYPDRVDRLVLAAPGLSGALVRGDTNWFAEGRLAYARGDSAAIARAWLKQPSYQPSLDAPTIAIRLNAIASDQGRYWMTVLRNNRRDFDQEGDPPAIGRTSNIRAPTLLIIGTRDTPDLRAVADTLVATVPQIRRVLIDGAGHFVSLDQAERFTLLVRDFLSR